VAGGLRAFANGCLLVSALRPPACVVRGKQPDMALDDALCVVVVLCCVVVVCCGFKSYDSRAPEVSRILWPWIYWHACGMRLVIGCRRGLIWPREQAASTIHGSCCVLTRQKPATDRPLAWWRLELGFDCGFANFPATSEVGRQHVTQHIGADVTP
jgi:hypothetical protein